jgi:Arc/MetJ-type ribon-helix-helix transcriptional regulator
MIIELKPNQEKIIREQLASGRYRSVDDVVDTALSKLTRDEQHDPGARRDAIRRMKDFGERHKLSLGEPITRKFLHEGHRI